MFVVISIAVFVLFFNYLRTVFGVKFPFYGSAGDVVFLLIAIPLLFVPSKQKITRWVRRSRSAFIKTGRVLILIAGYLILLMCAAYIPIALR
jgi:small neutral amino acid transporter SnatA (MarC family)